MAFDLDPGAGAGLPECCEVAFLLRDALAQLGLESFAKTSGSKGIQVYVPLNVEDVDYDHGTKALSKALARHLEAQHPKLIVSQQKKELRKGKVLIDWSQNDEHKTTVGVYSLRARERPTVSTPVAWEELEDPDALVFEAADVLERVEQHGDLFAPVAELRAGAARPVRIREVVLPGGGPGRGGRVPPRGVRREPGALRAGPGRLLALRRQRGTLRRRRRLGPRAGRADRGRRAVRGVASERRLLLRPGRQPGRADRARARARGRAADGGERGRRFRSRTWARRWTSSRRSSACPTSAGTGVNFSAVGDDHGLFIVVPVGRAWLFTDRPASDAPVRVTIEGSAASELRIPGSGHTIEVAST